MYINNYITVIINLSVLTLYNLKKKKNYITLLTLLYKSKQT